MYIMGHLLSTLPVMAHCMVQISRQVLTLRIAGRCAVQGWPGHFILTRQPYLFWVTAQGCDQHLPQLT